MREVHMRKIRKRAEKYEVDRMTGKYEEDR